MYTIQLNNTSDLFLQYLINTSKLHWRVEKQGVDEFDESGNRKPAKRTTLTDKEKQDHDLALVNKLFTLGYVMHRYKDPHKTWAPYAMDWEISEVNESHGGTGKSLFFESVKLLMKHVHINGRKNKLTEDNHIFGTVTEHTDLILINDCTRYVDYDFFFDPITNSMVCNPKHSTSYVLNYTVSPKIAFTSNYSLRNNNSSLERRLLFSVFSDYYHHTSDKNETAYTPYDDFKKNLFTDFTEEETNLFLNTVVRSVQFYLGCDEKINPPMDNVTARNMKGMLIDGFEEWADTYFTFENLKLNEYLVKNDCLKTFNDVLGGKPVTSDKFKKSLNAWCKMQGYQLNPKHMLNAKGRLQRTIDGTCYDMIYIHVPKKLIEPKHIVEVPDGF